MKWLRFLMSSGLVVQWLTDSYNLTMGETWTWLYVSICNFPITFRNPYHIHSVSSSLCLQ